MQVITLFLKRLHGDEQGVISIVTVFALFMFTLLMALLINVGRQVDDKIRMQNAADAAGRSGGIVLARGMNAVAFTNHLEAEVFSLTAYMRTAAAWGQNRGHNEQMLIAPILDAWEQAGRVFESAGRASGFTKFEALGRAIQRKVPLERQVVAAFGEMSAQHADLTLPVLEHILRGPDAQPGSAPDPRGGFIPRFQRAVVESTPELAQQAANDVAGRYSDGTAAQHRDQPIEARLWTTAVERVIDVNQGDPFDRTLPLVDPSPTGPDGLGGPRTALASRQRRELARFYLRRWIEDWLGPYFAFDGDFRPGRETAKMSNFIDVWRALACGQLERLLNEYPTTNLPFLIREIPEESNPNPVVEADYNFVAVVYQPHLEEQFPGLFDNPLRDDTRTDALAFSEVTVFVPKPRFRCCPWLVPVYDNWGIFRGLHTNRDNWSREWDALNQNWTAQLVPATSESILPILRSNPGGSLSNFRPPRLSGANMEDIRNLSRH